MKAIDTIYNGYRFRSRLEARWAVFFDTLGVKYEYEREGYDLDGIWYLPDFWLPEQDCWVEIKGEEPTQQEFNKGHRLAVVTGKNLYILSGEIRLPHDMGEYDGHYLCLSDWDQDKKYDENGDLSSDVKKSFQRAISFSDNGQWWCECPYCHKVGIQFEGRAARLCECSEGDRMHNAESPRLLEAYTAARQARFEHR
jgi:hypothetical protein